MYVWPPDVSAWTTAALPRDLKVFGSTMTVVPGGTSRRAALRNGPRRTGASAVACLRRLELSNARSSKWASAAGVGEVIAATERELSALARVIVK
jgi:hypothetical protein